MISLDITLAFQIVNFLISLFILQRLIIGPVLSIIAKRKAINDGLSSEAQSLNEKAGTRVEQYESRLVKARAEISAQREALKAEAEKASQAKVDAAGAEARSIRQDAAAAMNAQSTAARQELSGKVDNFAQLAIGKLLDA